MGTSVRRTRLRRHLEDRDRDQDAADHEQREDEDDRAYHQQAVREADEDVLVILRRVVDVALHSDGVRADEAAAHRAEKRHEPQDRVDREDGHPRHDPGEVPNERDPQARADEAAHEAAHDDRHPRLVHVFDVVADAAASGVERVDERLQNGDRQSGGTTKRAR
eukprot:31541-Pelagococcus_subviridis.AAC.1